MMRYFLVTAICFLGVTLIMPYLHKIALKYDFVDKPNERKIHKEPVPLIGGIAMYIVFNLAMIFFIGIDKKIISILAGGFIILVIGIVDDWYKTRGKDFPALPKLLFQVAAASLIFMANIRIRMISDPFGPDVIMFPVVIQYFLTILWVFGVTTVINFTDGMDGLAGGICSISSATLLVVSIVKGLPVSAVMSVMLIGVCLGFLRYNRHPAKIFMGDAGATFLGFILSIIAIEGPFKSATMVSLAIPVLALGVPIFDNIFVVIKRIMENKPCYMADKSQVHFRLLDSGLNQKQTVTFLYLVSICFSLTSIILLLIDK